MSFQSDISKLIFHHLVKEGYESSASNFVCECPHLLELKCFKPPFQLPRLIGPSLVDLIENYFESKKNIIEQLYLLKSVVFREQDDLQNLSKILVKNLKFHSPLKSKKETTDVGVNTIAFREDCPQACEFETIDFSSMYDRLLKNREFQEKIAENINNRKVKVVLPSIDSSKDGNLASSQDQDCIIKAIVTETQAGPAFDNLLKDCIGIDNEDQISVGSPEAQEPIVSHYHEENQENCLVASNLRAPMIVDPSTLASSICTVQNSDLLGNPSIINGLSSKAIATFSGQITLVSTRNGNSAITSGDVPLVGEKRKKKNPTVRKPAAMAPKPVFTIPALDSKNAIGESGYFKQRVEEQQQLVGCNAGKINVRSSSGPSTTKCMKVKNCPLAKRRWRKVAKTNKDPVVKASPRPYSSEKFITPSLAALVKIAQEYGSTSMRIEDQKATREKEPLKSPDVVFDSSVRNSNDFVSTPTTTLSHIQELSFGESPEFNNPASVRPVVDPKSPETPWDLSWRNAVTPPNSEIFEINKHKRSRFSAPVIGTEHVKKTPSSEPIASTPLFRTISHHKSSFISSTLSDKSAVTVVVPEPSVCNSTDSGYADLAAASILHEMAKIPVIEKASVQSLKRKTQETGVPPERNLSHFLADFTREEPVIQQPLPVFVTPRKDIVGNKAGISSTNSVTQSMPWDGQITSFVSGTPQIRPNLTSSTSPFQASLTKGFRFFPTAESPSQPLPTTPCLFEVSSSSPSIETPYSGFYQFPSLLSTHRLETLCQEIVETPPEHVPETEEWERRRRSSFEMDPLQLEESNDASDPTAVLMCEAVEPVAPPVQSPTPYMTDQTLENDLISECQRLKDYPFTERIELHNQRLVELSDEITMVGMFVPENESVVSLAPSTPITTKPKTRKPRRIAHSTSAPVDKSGNSACASVRIYSLNSQTHHRKSKQHTNNSNPCTPGEDELLIQEVLALWRLNSSVSSLATSPLNKKKKKPDSTSEKNHSMAVSSAKRIKRKRSNFPNESDLMSQEQISTFCSGTSKDVDVESVSNSPKKSEEPKKTQKETISEVDWSQCNGHWNS